MRLSTSSHSGPEKPAGHTQLKSFRGLRLSDGTQRPPFLHLFDGDDRHDVDVRWHRGPSLPRGQTQRFYCMHKEPDAHRWQVPCSTVD